MNYGGFCIHCKCASCEKLASCEVLYPSTEDYCQYYCQGAEFSMLSCGEYQEKGLSSEKN